MASIRHNGVCPVLLLSSPVFGSSQQLVAELALKEPASLVDNVQDLFRQAAAVTRKLLLGAKAADLPVKRSARFQLAINLKTAQVLSLTPLHIPCLCAQTR